MAQLVRRHDGRFLLGVCAGLADWWSVDRTLVRILYVLVSVCSAAFPGILCYLVLAILMPPEEGYGQPPPDQPPSDQPPSDQPPSDQWPSNPPPPPAS